MSKRVRVDEDEDCFLLQYRENASEWKIRFNWAFRYSGVDISRWDVGLSKTRCFIGWLTSREQDKNASMNPPHKAIIQIGINAPYVVYCNYRVDALFNTIEECLEYIEQRGYIPLDRGKTPFFAPAAARLARLAINAWCIVANRMGIPRDLRRLIGKMVWEEKHVWIP